MRECQRLMKLDTAPHLRIALLLIDNVAELIMAQKITNDLARNHQRGMVLKVAENEAGFWPDDLVEDARARYVPPRRRRDIDKWFDAKVDLLVEHKFLVEELGSGLKWLHRYRNDAYHNAELRTRVLRPAVRIYFYMCCDLLEGYLDSPPSIHRLWGKEEFALRFPVLAALSPLELMGAASAIPISIARKLQKVVEPDFDALKLDLIEHLRLRIEEIDTTLTEAYESLLNNEGWKCADILRIAQLNDLPVDQLPISLEKARSRRYRYGLADLARWKREAADLAGQTERYRLFAEFSKIESDLEPCCKLVHEALVQLDFLLQEAIDRKRGK